MMYTEDFLIKTIYKLMCPDVTKMVPFPFNNITFQLKKYTNPINTIVPSNAAKK